MARQKLQGTPGNDKIMGNTANQTIIGLAGNDLLDSGGGYDYVEGGAGNDTIITYNPLTTVKEKTNQGNDLIISSSSLNLQANIENVTITGTKATKVNGNGMNNILQGNSADNSFNGFGGNDLISGGEGKDNLDGLIGDDTLIGDNGNDRITGGSGNDILNGGNGDDLFLGGDDNDVINGGAGNDSLIGGAGNDSLIGGAGNDIFNVGSNGVDQIQDLSVSQDRIYISKKAFTSLSSKIGSGFSNNTEFSISASDSAAIGSPADFAYNTANGKLFYNDNLIATLSGGPDLTASNFCVVF